MVGVVWMGEVGELCKLGGVSQGGSGVGGLVSKFQISRTGSSLVFICCQLC